MLALQCGCKWLGKLHQLRNQRGESADEGAQPARHQPWDLQCVVEKEKECVWVWGLFLLLSSAGKGWLEESVGCEYSQAETAHCSAGKPNLILPKEEWEPATPITGRRRNWVRDGRGEPPVGDYRSQGHMLHLWVAPILPSSYAAALNYFFVHTHIYIYFFIAFICTSHHISSSSQQLWSHW